MSKVDWINWKTDRKEIINPEKINDKIFECFKNYNTYMNPVVYEQIKYEVNLGGLSKEAYQVMGESPANEIAVDILNKIDEIKQIMKNLQDEVKNLAEEQKQTEKEQLISEIKKKLTREEKLLENIQTNESLRTHIVEMGELPENVIYIIKDRIDKLKERLELAESL